MNFLLKKDKLNNNKNKFNLLNKLMKMTKKHLKVKILKNKIKIL